MNIDERWAWRLLRVPLIGRYANRQIVIPVTPTPTEHWAYARQHHTDRPPRHFVVRNDTIGLFWCDPYNLTDGDPRRQWGKLDRAWRFPCEDEARDIMAGEGVSGRVLCVDRAGGLDP